jgi:hypothetical protein
VTSATDAFTLIERSGDAFDAAVIDYDFDGEGYTGANIIQALRKKNFRARITLATAREEGALFDMTREHTLRCGADEALSTGMQDFEERLRVLLCGSVTPKKLGSNCMNKTYSQTV